MTSKLRLGTKRRSKIKTGRSVTHLFLSYICFAEGSRQTAKTYPSGWRSWLSSFLLFGAMTKSFPPLFSFSSSLLPLHLFSSLLDSSLTRFLTISSSLLLALSLPLLLFVTVPVAVPVLIVVTNFSDDYDNGYDEVCHPASSDTR